MRHLVAAFLVAVLHIVCGILLAVCKLCAVLTAGLYVALCDLSDRIEQLGVSQNAGNGE